MQRRSMEMPPKIKTSGYFSSGIRQRIGIVLVVMLFTGIISRAQQTPFKVFAHRGFRGLHPENTIKGLQKALAYDAILEFDLAITRDKQVVVSHDAVLNPNITQQADDQPLGKKNIRIYETDYATLSTYDVGKTPNKKFPEQARYPAHIPLFRDLVDSIKAFAAARGINNPTYFMETKITPETDGINHPDPKVFVDLMMQVVNEKNIQKQVIVQSFDPRTLQILRKKYPQIRLAFLAKDGTSFEENLNTLGFMPEYYSIDAPFMNQELANRCRERNIKLIIGNCDDYQEISRIAKLGVYGVISDFPLEWLSAHQDKH